MKKHVQISVEAAMVVITPYALARNSHHFFEAANNYDSGDEVPIVRYYLYCVSIELALKAAFLSKNCTADNKTHMRNNIGHNLLKAIEECKTLYDISFLTPGNLEAIQHINPYYEKKGLEYFTCAMMETALRGYKDLPPINDLENAARVIQSFSEEYKYFNDGNTSQKPHGGIINVV